MSPTELGRGFGALVAMLLMASIPCLTSAGEPTGLERSPLLEPRPGSELRDKDRDVLPPGAVQRLGTRRWRAGGQISAIAYSTDGKMLVTGGCQGVVQLWDSVTGEEKASFAFAPEEEVRCLSVSPDNGSVAAVAGDIAPHKQIVGIVNVSNGAIRLCSQSSEIQDRIDCLALSPDGKLLAGGGVGRVRLWQTASGEVLGSLTGGEGLFHCSAFSPDGETLIAVGENGIVHCWGTVSRKELHSFRARKAAKCITCSDDGKILAVGDADGGVFLYDLANGSQRTAWQTGGDSIRDLALSHKGGRVVAVSANGVISTWDVVGGRKSSEHRGEGVAWDCAVLSPSGGTVAGVKRDTDFIIRRWDVETGKELVKEQGHNAPIGLVGFPADFNRLVSVSDDGGVRTWDIRRGETTCEARMPDHRLGVAALSLDGEKLAFCADSGSVRIWGVGALKETVALAAASESVTRLAFLPNNNFLAAAHHTLPSSSRRNWVDCWDLRNGDERNTIRLDDDSYIDDLVCSPDGRVLAWTTGWEVAIWNVVTERMLRSIKSEPRIVSLSFSPDGNLLAGGSIDGAVIVWEVATGERVWVLKDGGPVVCWGCDGRTIITGDRAGTIHFWDWVSTTQIQRRSGHKAPVRRLAISRDGDYLASGGDDTTIVIWDTSRLRGSLPPSVSDVSDDELNGLWGDLGASVGVRPYPAIRTCLGAPEKAIAFLKAHLAELRGTDDREIAKWVTDLDDSDYRVREAASQALSRCGRQAEEAVGSVLRDNPSPEQRRRIDAILEAWAKNAGGEESLRSTRAIQILEQIGSPEARALLSLLAQGPRTAPQTRRAAEALERLRRQERSAANGSGRK